MNKMTNNEKIDMVYLWCDGNDIEFQKRKNDFLVKEGMKQENSDAVGDIRFVDNEELKYSLRSLEKYALWINHVYIVTDRQVPKWLNTDYEKVTIVDHSKILPQELIPCFNSNIIELYLAHIPGLSEKFLYGNDDMFFGRKVTEEDFFVGRKPIIRLVKGKDEQLEKPASKSDEYSYYETVINTIKTVNERYNKKSYYELHHNIDAYTKSIYSNALIKYNDKIKQMLHNRFRGSSDIQRLFINLDAVYSEQGILKSVKITRFDKIKSHFKIINAESYTGIDDTLKYQREITRFNPRLFCINSGKDTSVENKKRTKKFMEKLFPEKSRFEK